MISVTSLEAEACPTDSYDMYIAAIIATVKPLLTHIFWWTAPGMGGYGLEEEDARRGSEPCIVSC